MMGAVDKFLFKLENFDKENIPAKVIKALQPYLKVKYSIRIHFTWGAADGTIRVTPSSYAIYISRVFHLIYEIEILHYA